MKILLSEKNIHQRWYDCSNEKKQGGDELDDPYDKQFSVCFFIYMADSLVLL